MSFLTKPKATGKIGTVIRVSGGPLQDKFVMIAKEFAEEKDASGTVIKEAGYGVVVDNADWPAHISNNFNAIFVKMSRVVELSEAEQALVKTKFPSPDEFE
jgi:hypothetical protein